MRRFLPICMMWCAAAAGVAQNVEIHIPIGAIAGNPLTISTTGSGKAIFYLVGPGIARKKEINLVEGVRLQWEDLQNAGSYQAIVCSDTCRSATFYVGAAKPSSLSFLVHPSRVPVSSGDVLSGVALPFDQFRNLVLAPAAVNFLLVAGNTSLFSRTARTQDGVAWFRTTSGRSAGALQVTAALDNVSARRVVQQVASDPCSLRIESHRTAAGILVETQPVHDCTGNPVPDGTIVTFTATESGSKSTVDAPIKQGIARAQMAASSGAVISVASGVVMGNELRVGAQP